MRIPHPYPARQRKPVRFPTVDGRPRSSALVLFLLSPLLLLLSTAPALATVDSDGDRMSDAFELANGLNPADPDQNGNGLLDGQEDIDGEGLGNAAEEIAGTDPRVADTDGDGLEDDEELAPLGYRPRAALANRNALAQTVVVDDVDGDGDLDILVGENFPGSLHLYENTGGTPAFVEHVISTSAPSVWTIETADLDGDGDPDLVATGRDFGTSSFFLDWYENVGPPTFFSGPTAITAGLHTPRFVAGTDMDADGDLDLLFGDFIEGTLWLENTDGLGSFGPDRLISTDKADATAAADFDGDGALDIGSIGSSAGSTVSNLVVWRRSIDLATDLWSAPMVAVTEVNAVRSVRAADVDADGDPDLVYGSNDRFGWLENTDGLGTFGPGSIRNDAIGGFFEDVLPFDVEGDGDLDLLLLVSGEGLWVSVNADGAGTLASPVLIDSGFPGSTSTNPVALGDVDGSGENDVVAGGGSPLEDPVFVLRARRTASPLLVDSDGDGFDDDVEVANGSDPLDPESLPNFAVPALGGPALAVLGALLTLAGGLAVRRSRKA